MTAEDLVDRAAAPATERPVLLVSPDYPPPLVGGSLVYISILAQHYPGALDILAGPQPTPSGSEITDPRHRVHRSALLVASTPDPPRHRLVVMYAFLLLGTLFGARRYRAIVTHGYAVTNSLMFLAGRLRNVPVVGVEYGETIRMPLAGTGLKNRMKRWLITHLYPLASGFVALSAETRDLLGTLGVDPAVVTLIPPMLAADKQHGVTQDHQPGRIVFSCGRLVRRKGFHHVIDAAALLAPSMPDLRVLIAGNGPMRPALDRQIASLRLEKTVTLLGRVSDDDLAACYRRCDVFVLASVMLPNGDSEDAPSVAIEASSYGKPVIIGTAGGTSACVGHGVTGYRIDPSDVHCLADTIARVLDNPPLARELGRAGQKRIEDDHDPRKAGQLLHDLVAAVTGRRPMKPARAGAASA